MSPSYAVLKAEVTTDPLSRGYAGMTDAQVAADLNLAIYPLVNPVVSLKTLGIWAAKTGVRAKIAAAAANSQSAVQSVCLSLQDLFTGLAGPGLDLSNSDNLAMMSALQTAGIMSSADATSLQALTVVGQTSRAIGLVGWGIPVQAPDITFVRSN